MGVKVGCDCPACGHVFSTTVSGKGKHARKCPQCKVTFMLESKQKQPGGMNRKDRRDMNKKFGGILKIREKLRKDPILEHVIPPTVEPEGLTEEVTTVEK